MLKRKTYRFFIQLSVTIASDMSQDSKIVFFSRRKINFINFIGEIIITVTEKYLRCSVCIHNILAIITAQFS